MLFKRITQAPDFFDGEKSGAGAFGCAANSRRWITLSPAQRIARFRALRRTSITRLARTAYLRL